jgi:lysophospholipase
MEEFDRRTRPRGMRLWTWKSADGWLHRRMDWPQPQGRPRGSLLFAAGRGDFVEKYLEAFATWHRQGWQVSSFDWRGQGGSKGEAGDANFETFDPLLDDFSSITAEWIAANPGPHVIIGHSMGAHMLLRLLVERPPPVASAVLIAPMILVNSGPLPAWLASGLASLISGAGMGERPLWRAPLAQAPAGSKRQKALTNCLDRDEDERFWWGKDADFAPAAPSFGWLRAAFRSARTFKRARLGAIDVPILIIGSEEDRLVSAAAIRRTAAQIRGAELLMLQGCAHEILREVDEPRVAALSRIDRFLEEHAR